MTPEHTARLIKKVNKASQRQAGYQLQAKLDRKDIAKNTDDIEILSEAQTAVITAMANLYSDLRLAKQCIAGLLITTILLGIYVII